MTGSYSCTIWYIENTLREKITTVKTEIKRIEKWVREQLKSMINRIQTKITNITMSNKGYPGRRAGYPCDQVENYEYIL